MHDDRDRQRVVTFGLTPPRGRAMRPGDARRALREYVRRTGGACVNEGDGWIVRVPGRAPLGPFASLWEAGQVVAEVEP